MWSKLDDQFYLNPKIANIDRDEQDLYIAGIIYCNGQLTDGFIPNGVLTMLCSWAKIPLEANAQAIAQAIASRLVEHCLWENASNGYMVHDFLEWNPSREEVLALKYARSEAGRRGGKKSRGKNSKNEASAQANAEAIAQAKSKQNSTPSPSPLIKELREGADAPLSQSEEKPEEKKSSTSRKSSDFHDPLWDTLHGLPPQALPAKQPPDIEWVPPDIQEHMAVFLVSTGLPVPLDQSTRGWWIKEMQTNREYGLTPAEIKSTVARMRETNTFIKSPGSVRAIGLDMKATGSVPRIDPEMERHKRITASIYRDI